MKLRNFSRLGAILIFCAAQLSACVPFVPIILTATALTSCVPLVLTAAAVTVVDVSHDRRTTGAYLDDNFYLEVPLRKAIAKDDALQHTNISVTAFNNVVLFTGEVNTEAQRQYVSALAERLNTPQRREVHVVNELALAGRTNISSRFNDAWLTGKVKARLVQAKGLPARAVKVVTEHGKVYLLGLVTRAEAEIAVEAARQVRGVTHIVKVFQYIQPAAKDA